MPPYWQGIVLVGTMALFAARLLAAAIYSIIGVEYALNVFDPLVLAFIVALNIWPGMALLRVWMRAHGIWRE